MKETNGVIPIYKEKGMTSFDVVKEIKKVFKTNKVGHTGTLDPLAEGVLLVCIGKATKIVELLTANEKEYIAKVKLGIETDTLDIEGEVLKEEKVNNINLKETINSYKNKTYLQEVPKYSAIKVNGKKLYEYARENIEVELPKKEVTIKEIELIEEKENEFIFKTLVTKGTYIRSLIRDICHDMGTIGTMTELLRTKQGNIKLEECFKLNDIKNNNYKIYSIDEVLNYKKIEVDEETYKKISNGVKIPNNYDIVDKVIFTYNNDLLGIYKKDNDILKVWKNFI